MFKKHLVSALCIWFILILGCIKLLYAPSFDAKMAYRCLMHDGDEAKKELKEGNSTQQTRQQVSKQILYQKGLHRLQSRLISNDSEIIYSKKEGELIERFRALTCTMQEELKQASTESAEQIIRQFKAEEAIYSYKSGQLEAEEVEVAHYLLPGEAWPDSMDNCQPILQGQARTIHLSLFKDPNLKAQGFQAIFHDWEEEW